MTRIPASKFKATCLAVLARVAATREPVTITRFGKPIAQLSPVKPASHNPRSWARARGTVEILGDVVAPTSEIAPWNAQR